MSNTQTKKISEVAMENLATRLRECLLQVSVRDYLEMKWVCDAVLKEDEIWLDLQKLKGDNINEEDRKEVIFAAGVEAYYDIWEEPISDNMSTETKIDILARRMKKCLSQISVEEFKKSSGLLFLRVFEQSELIWFQFHSIMGGQASYEECRNFKIIAGVWAYFYDTASSNTYDISDEEYLDVLASRLKKCLSQISVEEFKKGVGAKFLRVSQQLNKIWRDYDKLFNYQATQEDYEALRVIADVEEYYQ